MVPILDLQKRLQEAGRIRIGQQVETRSGKKRPAALDTFRLTSRDKARIDAAAKLYGGKVAPWDNNGRQEFEVITQSDKLPVVVPPGAMSFSQFFELWSAGGCQRRCNGSMELLSEQPCLCDPDDRQCEYHTRLSLFLRDVPGLGLWRLDTQGYYAAVELHGAVDIISVAAGKGQMLPATLRLDKRDSKRVDETLHKFVVPVLDIEITPAQLLMGAISSIEPRQPALTPVPESKDPVSIEEQVKAAETIESRRKRAAPIPATGVVPRTANQVRAANKPVTNTGAPEGSFPESEGSFPESIPTDPWTAESAVTSNDDSKPGQGGLFEPQSPPDSSGLVPINQRQLGIIGHLFDVIGFERGDKPRLDWCSNTLGRVLSSPQDLSSNDAVGLISKLTMLQRIRVYYTTADYDAIVDDLTQYLQLENRLDRIEHLSDMDIQSVIEAIDMSEETGRPILGVFNQQEGCDETTNQTKEP